MRPGISPRQSSWGALMLRTIALVVCIQVAFGAAIVLFVGFAAALSTRPDAWEDIMQFSGVLGSIPVSILISIAIVVANCREKGP